MKKYFTLLALALVTLVSCDKGEPGETPEKEYDVYITGRLFGETAGAAYWKNGVKVKLPVNNTNGSSSESVFVSNGDVYITGYENKDAVLELSRAVYWKNGEKVTLPEDNSIVSSASASTFATGICVVGNDIYIAGGLMKKNSDDADENEKYPVYWKNGELVELTEGVSDARSIRVEGNDVYVEVISMLQVMRGRAMVIASHDIGKMELQSRFREKMQIQPQYLFRETMYMSQGQINLLI